MDSETKEASQASSKAEEFHDRLVDRAYFLAKCENDKKLQEQVLEMCRRDPVYWFNMFCWTFDPRRAEGEPKDIPFVLYPFQEWTIRQWYDCIEAQEPFCIEKSRDMGVSWMMMLLIQYCWLFKTGWNFLVGSYKENLVDTASMDPSTLFGKFRYNLDKLPRWMKPEPKNIQDKKLHIQNMLNGNLLTGDSANPNFGRGARQRAIFVDEFAQWEAAEAVWAGIASTTNCQIVNATPYGESNQYARIMNNPANEFIQVPGAEQLYKTKMDGVTCEEISSTLDTTS